MSICLFGGTFDPPHIGHLILADAVISDYIKDWNVKKGGESEIEDKSISDPIPNVFYIKTIFTAVSGSIRKVCINLKAYKPTVS